jgi:hypothetical protein
MTLFGAYDRELFANEGLFASEDCADAAVSIIADSDQRTRETGKALAAGMFPGCNVDVKALPEGTPIRCFTRLSAGDMHVGQSSSNRGYRRAHRQQSRKGSRKPTGRSFRRWKRCWRDASPAQPAPGTQHIAVSTFPLPSLPAKATTSSIFRAH